jgi:hypothetical protein
VIDFKSASDVHKRLQDYLAAEARKNGEKLVA